MNLKKGISLAMALGLFSGASLSAQAQNKSKLIPLQFEAERNGLKILPQRFDYTLIDDYKIKIGDVLIDTELIKFSVEKGADKENYNLTFTWPIHLFESGELSLKNTTGKAIITAQFESKDLKIITPQTAAAKTENSEGGNSENPSNDAPAVQSEDLRTDLAAFTVKNVSRSIIDDLKYMPYMSFCVLKQSFETRLYLCSNELFLSSADGQLTVKSRSPRRSQSAIEVNGKSVGEQGLIYLNDRNENISFRSLSKHGSTVEIDTRMKDVDFKDIITVDDGKAFILTASGTEPVSNKRIKRDADGTWKGKLPSSRPLLYLKGDGDIPMRQEFYVTKNLPKNSQRVFISGRTHSKTYSNRVQVQGIGPQGVQVSTDPEDKFSKVDNLGGKNQFKWEVSELTTGAPERKFVQVSQGEDTFYAGFDFLRGHPFLISAQFELLPSSKLNNASLDFQWWIENFLGLENDTFKFRWGLEANYKTALSRPENIDKFDSMSFLINWRAKQGLHLIDPTWGLKLGMHQWAIADVTLLSPVLGAFYTQKFSEQWQRYLDWYTISVDAYAGATADNLELGPSLKLGGTLLKRLSNRWLLSAGASLNYLNWEDSVDLEKFDVGVHAGVSLQF